MPNPYAQAALTYYRRFRSVGRIWVQIGIAVVWLFMVVMFIHRPHETVPIFLMFIGAFPSIAMVFHLKDQFVDARVHSMPNYLRVHAIVTVAAVLIFTVFFPLLLSLLAGLHSVCLVACFTTIFTAILSIFLGKVFLTVAVPFLLCGLFIFSLSTEAGCIFAKEFFSGKHEPLAYAITCFNLAMIFLGLFRLFRLTEDDPKYQQLQAVGFNKSMAPGQNCTAVPLCSRKQTDWLADRHIARLSRHARRASISRRSRICRWQPGINAALFLRICCMTVIISLVPLLMVSGKHPSILMLAMLVGIIPTTTLGGTYYFHRLSYEIMLPVDRVSYIRQMGISAAIALIVAWAASWSILIFFFTRISTVPIRLDVIENLTLISALCQVLYYGIAVWIARYRSRILHLGAILIPLYLQMFLMAMASEYQSGAWGTTMVFVAGIVAAVGLLISYDAYRRWLVADLD